MRSNKNSSSGSFAIVPNDKSASNYEYLIGKSLSHFEKTFADLSLKKQLFETWIKNLLETPF
jgi:hypothetical protein